LGPSASIPKGDGVLVATPLGDSVDKVSKGSLRLRSRGCDTLSESGSDGGLGGMGPPRTYARSFCGALLDVMSPTPRKAPIHPCILDKK